MKALLVLLTLLFTLTAHAGPAQLNSVINPPNESGVVDLVEPDGTWAGGHAADPSYTTLICTLAGNSGGSTGNYYRCWNQNLTSDTQYQVPTTAGVKFKVYSICAVNLSGANSYQIATSTATFSNGAASITGGVHTCGADAIYCLWAGAITAPKCTYPIGMEFANSTYPAIQIGSATGTYVVTIKGKAE